MQLYFPQHQEDLNHDEKSGKFAHFDNKCFIKSKTNDIYVSNLDSNSNLRFYVSGSTNNSGSTAYIDQWNKVSHEVCNEIPMKIEEENSISYLPDKVNYNSIILNLNQIDKNTVLVYYVYCSSYLINQILIDIKNIEIIVKS